MLFFLNNIEIFNFLIQNGFQFQTDDIFYNQDEKKCLKFALYLHFLREKKL